MFRKTEILVLATTVMMLFTKSVLSKRGPHHPRGEVQGKVNEHIVHSDEHLKADLSASNLRPDKPVEEMSVDEKQFYHFKMHDYDNNNLLDGLEILQSANVHDASFHGSSHGHNHEKAKTTSQTGDHDAVDEEDSGGTGSEELGLQHLVDIIDGFLLVADKNNDGYLNFNEYKETLRDSTDHELGAGDYPDEMNGDGDGDDNKLD